MGLDMYAHKAKKLSLDIPEFFDDTQVDKNIEIVDAEEKDATEFWYWRKHPNLHGWFEKLYKKKGGTEEFNCMYLELTLEDLNQLEHDVSTNNLPYTTGFFFGKSDPDNKKYDLMFIKAARKAMKKGYTIYYEAWY